MQNGDSTISRSGTRLADGGARWTGTAGSTDAAGSTGTAQRRWPVAALLFLCIALPGLACDGNGIRAINTYTGEIRTYQKVNEIPAGWDCCVDPSPGCPGLESCHVLDRASCWVRSDCEVLRYGVQPEECDPRVSDDCPELFQCVDAVFTCELTDCGDLPNAVSYFCPDGSIAGFTGRCIETLDQQTLEQQCEWEILTCPTS